MNIRAIRQACGYIM